MITNDQERDALIKSVEDALRNRLASFGLKVGTKKALEAETHFLSGAMVAINALCPSSDPNRISPVIPPKWVWAPMRGTSVLETR